MTARLFPFPVLRMTAASGEVQPPYQGGAQFLSEVSRKSGDDANIVHNLQGENLVSSLLRQGRAKFACVVCVPSTMYRTLAIFDGKFGGGEKGGQPFIEARQRVPLADSLLSSPPFFRSLVVAAEEISRTVGEGDGLHKAYHGKNIVFPEGAILAAADWMELGGAGSLLVLRQDENLAEKTIRVDEDTQQGYRFIVRVPVELFRQLKICPQSRRAHRDSIFTHALSRGLEILVRHYGPDSSSGEESGNWEEYANLRWLQSELKSKDYADWTEEGFCPEEAATLLRGHEIPADMAEDNGE
jgi:hypothetical protein